MKRLIAALGEVGFGIAGEIDPKEILERHVFLFADQIRIDVFTRPWGVEDFDACWGRRQEARFEGAVIPFLGLQDLILSKRTGRDQDEADVEALEQIARNKTNDTRS